MGNRYGKLPSEIIGIEKGLKAFVFDSSILYRANKLQEKEMDEKKEEKKEGGVIKGWDSLVAMQNDADRMRSS